MKFFRTILAACSLMLAITPFCQADRVVYNQALVNETALTYNTTYTLDLGNSLLPWSNIDSLSMQAVYSSATISAVSFIDGTKSTGSITVSSYPALTGLKGTNTLSVSTNSALTGISFFLNGMQFAQGDLWTTQGSSAATAINISTAINAFAPAAALVSASTTSLGVVTLTCVSSGIACNAITLTSNRTSLRAGSATFSGGRNQGFLVINGTVFSQGAQFTAATSSEATAASILTIVTSSLSAVIAMSTPTTTPGIIRATSTVVGAIMNYGWFSSSAAALTCTNNRLYGGTDSAVSTTTDKITSSGHGFTTGLPVLLTKSAGTIPTGLTTNATYFAIRSDATTFKLATTSTGAVAGSAVDITAITGSGSFTLTPLGLTGTPSFKWQGSNDNTNYNDISVSSVTMSSLAAATTIWDFGSVGYRYVRINVVAPTTGGIALVVTGVGKSKW